MKYPVFIWFIINFLSAAMIRQNPATRPSTRDPEWLGWWCWLRCYKLLAGWSLGATRLQQCELLIIHLRHFSGITAPRLSSAPGAVINLPSLVRLPLSVRDSDAEYCEVTSLADLRSYHPSPRHYGCQGYLWSHREYLLNPLKFNGEHKSGMRGMWNAILFLWRHYPPGVLTSEIISNRHKVEWINAGNLSKISDTTDNISHRFHDKVGAKYTGINAG